ncbi:MAG: 3'(2'),5'-bisphosphate nucleotidase CysQ [Rhizobiaceae bacterium]|nr:3'(2'),5'-bisphosphate nucleotidase CysQ [Rhizobiaceae bacterium]
MAPRVRNTGEDLALLVEAATAAGREALKFFRNDVQVWWKNGGSSPVTAADHAANDILRDILRAARPGYGWLSEESEDDPDRLARDRVFIVDPIDGTRAFMEGRDTWVVSAAVTERGRSLAGVLYAPSLDELYVADATGRVEKNGEAIATRRPGGPMRISAADDMMKRFGRGLGEIERLSRIPSLAYRLAMIADGRLDATIVKANAHDWDLAAADLILANAGGRVTDIHGAAPVYNLHAPRHDILFAARSDLLPLLVEAAGKA